jgi:hypothetical protein
MKQIRKILLIIGLSVVQWAIAQDAKGFAEISFGESKEKVIEEILLMGYNPMGQGLEDEKVIIPIFKLGDLPVQVTFFFNKNDKFYSFELRTGKVSAADYDTKVLLAADYMSKVFEKKFGAVSDRNRPKVTALKEGFRTFYWKWTRPSTEIYTAITAIDASCFVIGSVTHKSLALEKPISSAPKADRKLEDAATSF